MNTPLTKWTLPTLWLLLTGCLQLFLLNIDYGRIQKQVNDEAGYLYDSIYDRTRLNEVLLQSFTTLVDAQPDDHQALRRFATGMRTRNPHIARLQLQERVSINDQNAFEETMRTRGYDYFSIRFGEDQTQVSGNQGERIFFPFTFLEPFNSETRRFLGLDMSTNTHFAQSFLDSVYYRRPVATEPFILDDGRSAYTLYQVVYANNHSPDDSFQVASLVVTFEGLLPATPAKDAYTQISLLDANGRLLVNSGQLPENNWLPTLSVTHKLNRFGQPLQVQLSRSMVWSDINWVLMAGALLFSLALLKLTQAYTEQKRDGQQQRLAVLQELETERNQLESHVNQRTQELNAQLLENQRLAHRVMEVQENERRHLARELHDELGQSLTAIRTDARLLKRLHPNETSAVHQSADSIDTIARHIYAVTYDLMRYLRPTSLDDLGLVDALHECISNLRLRKNGIQLETRFSGPLNEMAETYNITLYRLVQESLTNTLRHAAADHITLELHRYQSEQEDFLELSVTDNGHGFSQSEESKGGGFGLIGMRERVNALGGQFRIQSSPEYGTRVDVVIPIPSKAEEAAVLTQAIPYQADKAVPLH